jgi:DNA-binding HxlR family transcriptional regulator
VLRELDRWRFCLSRHLRFLGGFASQRTCDRRLALLIEAGYIDRRNVLYGLPRLYFLTKLGRTLINATEKTDKFRLEQIHHDIAVLDTAVYFLLKRGVALCGFVTKKELHQGDGYGPRRHRPDFTFQQAELRCAVEVELSTKTRQRLVTNLRAHFMDYDRQVWVVPQAQGGIARVLEENAEIYPNLEIIALEEVTGFIKSQL